MKRLLIAAVAIYCTLFSYIQAGAQAPAKFNYQGVARNASGQPLASQALGLRLSIRDLNAAGTVVYQETHAVNTNAYGLYSVAVGGGSVVSGAMGDVNWGTGDKYLQVEMDPAGGASYTDLGTSQLLSVPYAMYSGSGTRVSAFQPAGCQFLNAVTSTLTKIDDMGTFTKHDDNTLVELAVQTVLNVASFGTAAGVVFELRVDNTATTIGVSSVLLRNPGSMTPVTLVGIFENLPAGVHTVSLWARGAGGTGTATNASWDSGCFNSAGVNNVLVKEYN
ncbi:MAG: hypothetical protein H3C54_07075 [Taibaiella sp.]|nr:hypothetical protein [Taibaiella sp.]